jgi:hypothetical protein
VLYGPRRLGEILREPVLLGLVAGAVLAWRARVGCRWIALGLALAAFAILATAGLPIITRYLLVPAALACTLCGGALAAGLEHRAWAPVSVLVLIALLVFAPGQVRRIDRLERSIAIQERIPRRPRRAARRGAALPAAGGHQPPPGAAPRAALRRGAARRPRGPARRRVHLRRAGLARGGRAVRVRPARPGARAAAAAADFRRAAGNRSWTVVVERGPEGRVRLRVFTPGGETR